MRMSVALHRRLCSDPEYSATPEAGIRSMQPTPMTMSAKVTCQYASEATKVGSPTVSAQTVPITPTARTFSRRTRNSIRLWRHMLISETFHADPCRHAERASGTDVPILATSPERPHHRSRTSVPHVGKCALHSCPEHRMPSTTTPPLGRDLQGRRPAARCALGPLNEPCEMQRSNAPRKHVYSILTDCVAKRSHYACGFLRRTRPEDALRGSQRVNRSTFSGQETGIVAPLCRSVECADSESALHPPRCPALPQSCPALPGIE